MSVWADQGGEADGSCRVSMGAIVCERALRPWLLATSLDDLAHLRQRTTATRYRELDGEEGSLSLPVTAPDGRALSNT